MSFRQVLCLIILSISISLNAQIDSIVSKLTFELDYRFRAEQDWGSKKSDGSLRTDRSRLRYRLRTGATYENENYSVSVRLRTGDPKKQQDPQLTLGKGLKEFGTLPIGFEKAYFQYRKNNYIVWLGKNTYPFEKNNELFWSDNVFPEGVLLEKSIPLKSNFVNQIKVSAGHFILSSNNNSFSNDAYFQGLQTSISMLNNNLKIFPSIYLLRNIPNIPDGEHSFLLDYKIFHFGSKFSLLKNKKLSFDFDYYQNLENYTLNQNIGDNFMNQKTGYTIGLKYGKLKIKNDWFVRLTYANLQKYSVLDYMAQNDWARWDYSSFNSPDGRLSNLQGIELVFAYAFSKKMNFVSKYYFVEQLILQGISRENGQRIRFDINVKI
jgi:hypothetical protein